MTTLSAHEILMLVPEARFLWDFVSSNRVDRCGETWGQATTAANEAVEFAYADEAQRRHDAAVKRTQEGR